MSRCPTPGCAHGAPRHRGACLPLPYAGPDTTPRQPTTVSTLEVATVADPCWLCLGSGSLRAWYGPASTPCRACSGTGRETAPHSAEERHP